MTEHAEWPTVVSRRHTRSRALRCDEDAIPHPLPTQVSRGFGPEQPADFCCRSASARHTRAFLAANTSGASPIPDGETSAGGEGSPPGLGAAREAVRTMVAMAKAAPDALSDLISSSTSAGSVVGTASYRRAR